MGDLFDHLDRIEKRETPLPSIRSDLSDDQTFVLTNDECPREDCSGSLWSKITASETFGPELVCDRCAYIWGDSGPNVAEPSDNEWHRYWTYRPRYSSSDRVRLPGSFNHEWIEASDADGPVSDVDPESFYR